MLVYLSKKIAVPNDVVLTCLAWHGTRGYIVCGGEQGLLKVLLLEPQRRKGEKRKGLAATSNLAMNQTLEGYKCPMRVVVWNEVHNRLTSSDDKGLIRVWLLYKNTWCEEMINERNKSVVQSMAWNKDGKKICIVYEDGAVIVGSVDGNRMWGKDLKGLKLTHVQWSPNGRVLLFGTGTGEIHIYNSHGTFNSKMALHCLSGVTGVVKLAGIVWYNGKKGFEEPNCPCLLVAFDNGRLQLMRSELDDAPILIDTGLFSVVCVDWNHTGSLFAVGGNQSRELNVVQFYNIFGQHLHTLSVPKLGLCSLAWEGSGLRVCFGVGPFIYFANVRLDYQWGYFSDTVVYMFRKPDKIDHCLIFWNTKTGERHAKSVKNLLHITAHKDMSLLAAKVEDEYVLLLCNALGTPLESKYIQMEPQCISLSHTHVAVASRSAVYIWHFRTASRLAMSELTYVSRKGWEGQEKLIHIDEVPSEAPNQPLDFQKAAQPTSDPICCVCASDRLLLIGRESGVILCYSLPGVSLDGKFSHSSRPLKLNLNCNSTKLSIINTTGHLNLYDLDIQPSSSASPASLLSLEKKDVWDFKWAEDNPDLFAVMEKTRMYIFRGVKPEEPIQSSSHICRFADMSIVAVLMDDILQEPEHPTEEHIQIFNIKSLRDTRNMLLSVGLQDTCQFIEDNAHPKLWKLLAEASLDKLELELAEKAFVRCQDYQGIRFVKSLQHLSEDAKKKAEVSSFLMRFDEAERLYLDLDCRHLAVDLRVRLGDWFRVVQLLKSGGGAAGNDVLLAQAWNAIGDYYYDRQQWQQAVSYYRQGHAQHRLAECYYLLEDYVLLERLSNSLPENNPLLPKLAEMFSTVGMCTQAVSAFIKVNMIKKAIDCCVELNQWDQALSLARSHKIQEINPLLTKYASHLLQKNDVLSAIEFYRKAHQYSKAAQLLTEVAKAAASQGVSLQNIKKIYVLSALLIKRHYDEAKKQQHHKAASHQITDKKTAVQMTLTSLLQEDISSAHDVSLLDHAWRGAEAYHFYMLAQKQLYSGFPKMSLRTLIHLWDYDDVLPVTELYSLVALTSCVCGVFGVCSKAFIKLESLEDLPDKYRQQIQNVSMEIFTKHAPKDMHVAFNPIHCPSCNSKINEWTNTCPTCQSSIPVCIATGQPLLAYHTWVCPVCRHSALEVEIKNFQCCPLCHSRISS